MQHSARIVSAFEGDVTYYKICVESAGQAWTVERRYNDFLSLYNALPRQHEGGPSLPVMPPKSTFQKLFVPGFMDRRICGLDAVLKAAVVDDPFLIKHEALRKFLQKGVSQPSAGSKVSTAQGHVRQEIYDPCSPENVKPATDIEVADGEVRLLTQQLFRIESMLSKRERVDPEGPLVQDYRCRACELRRLVDEAKARRAALNPQEPALTPATTMSDVSTSCPSDAGLRPSSTPTVCFDG